MTDYDAQEARIEAILGEDESLTFDDAVEKFYEHLRRFIQLPCDVTGVEDFRWEEYYVLGPGSLIEYQKLRETQPSYQDIFSNSHYGNSSNIPLISRYYRSRKNPEDFCKNYKSKKIGDFGRFCEILIF